MDGSAAAWKWHHNGYAVADLDRAIAFHREVFGYEVYFEVRGLTDLIQDVTGLAGISCSLAQMQRPTDGMVLELLQFDGVPDDVEEALPVRPGRAHAAFLVEDLDASLAALEQAGGSLCGRITTFAEGRGVYCRTPVGSVIELLEQPRPAPRHDTETVR